MSILIALVLVMGAVALGLETELLVVACAGYVVGGLLGG